MGTGKFRQLVPSPESRSFVLTFSHPDLPRSKSAGAGCAIAPTICRLGTGLTVGSGLTPDPPRPFARPRVAGSPFHKNGITAGRDLKRRPRLPPVTYRFSPCPEGHVIEI